MRTLLLTGYAFLFSILLTSSIATAQDLNNWVQKGPASSGSWVVASGGQSVTQAQQVDNAITFFVSDKTYSDVELRYKVNVQTARDDDHIGFVVGFNEPMSDAEADSIDTDFILIDWKQAFQNSGGFIAEEGLAISAFSGRFSTTSAGNAGNWPFWTHEPEAGFDTLATAFGDTFGWEDNIEYDVIINYSPTQITVDVEGGTGAFQNGLRVFDVAGTFEPGSAGFYTYSQEGVLFTVEDIVAVSVEDPNNSIPVGATLDQNYPNPFQKTTTFTYMLSNPSDVRLRVFNTLGQHVATLVEGRYSPGSYSTTWDGSGLPGGLYVAIFEAGDSSIAKKIVMLK